MLLLSLFQNLASSTLAVNNLIAFYELDRSGRLPFLFKAFFMSRYLQKQRNKLYQYMRNFILPITRYVRTEGEVKNFIQSYGRGNITTRNSFFRILTELSKPQMILLFSAIDSLKFSDDYVDGFCIEFTYKKFKHITDSNSFYNSRRVFVEKGLLLKVEGTNNYYILNPEYIIKGKAKQPEKDYDGNIISLNNYNTFEKEKQEREKNKLNFN